MIILGVIIPRFFEIALVGSLHVQKFSILNAWIFNKGRFRAILKA